MSPGKNTSTSTRVNARGSTAAANQTAAAFLDQGTVAVATAAAAASNTAKSPPSASVTRNNGNGSGDPTTTTKPTHREIPPSSPHKHSNGTTSSTLSTGTNLSKCDCPAHSAASKRKPSPLSAAASPTIVHEISSDDAEENVSSHKKRKHDNATASTPTSASLAAVVVQSTLAVKGANQTTPKDGGIPSSSLSPSTQFKQIATPSSTSPSTQFKQISPSSASPSTQLKHLGPSSSASTSPGDKPVNTTVTTTTTPTAGLSIPMSEAFAPLFETSFMLPNSRIEAEHYLSLAHQLTSWVKRDLRARCRATQTFIETLAEEDNDSSGAEMQIHIPARQHQSQQSMAARGEALWITRQNQGPHIPPPPPTSSVWLAAAAAYTYQQQQQHQQHSQQQQHHHHQHQQQQQDQVRQQHTSQGLSPHAYAALSPPAPPVPPAPPSTPQAHLPSLQQQAHPALQLQTSFHTTPASASGSGPAAQRQVPSRTDGVAAREPSRDQSGRDQNRKEQNGKAQKGSKRIESA